MLWEPPGKAEGAWLKFNFGQVAPYSVSAALVLVLIYVSISGKQSPRSLAWGRDFLESVTATVSPPSLTIINSFSGAFGTYSNSCMGLSENYTTNPVECNLGVYSIYIHIYIVYGPNIYIYMYVYIRYIYMYVCMYICIYVYKYICIYVCIYVCMYICKYVYMYICIYVNMYIYMHIYIYLCTHIYIYVCVCISFYRHRYIDR